MADHDDDFDAWQPDGTQALDSSESWASPDVAPVPPAPATEPLPAPEPPPAPSDAALEPPVVAPDSTPAPFPPPVPPRQQPRRPRRSHGVAVVVLVIIGFAVWGVVRSTVRQALGKPPDRRTVIAEELRYPHL